MLRKGDNRGLGEFGKLIQYKNKAYRADSNDASAAGATSTLDYIKRQLAFSRLLTTPNI